MKLIFEPKAYLVGTQVVKDYYLDEFLLDHGVSGWESDSEIGGEILSEVGGRVCYMSFAKPRPGGNSAYLHHIKEVGHGSVLEHAVWNLIVTGVSRSLTHEFVRHRSGFGYSQLSQRYVDESVAEYVVPPDLQQEVVAAEASCAWCSGYVETSGEPDGDGVFGLFLSSHPEYTREMVEAGRDWLEAVDFVHQKYRRLAEYQANKAIKLGLEKTEARKFARQSARSVLPNATETKIFVTANARALRHFFNMRGALAADPEIRNLAILMWEVMVKESPNHFGDFSIVNPDNPLLRHLKTDFPKV